MSNSLFELFAGMIDNLPARAVCSAVDLECRTLSDDLAAHREEPMDEILSIESFHFFLQNAKESRDMPGICFLPPEHFDFYRATVGRLIAAGELPSEAMRLFDDGFLSGRRASEGCGISLRLEHLKQARRIH